MLSGTILLCIICVLTLLAWWTKKQRAKYPEPPTYPGAIPIIGHLFSLLGSCERIWRSTNNFSDYCMTVGGVLKINIGLKTLYAITEPDDVLTVTTKCLDKSFIYEFAKAFSGKGLVTSDLTSWKKNRKRIAPFFNQRAVNEFLVVFNKQAHRLVDKLAAHVGNGKFDHSDITLNNILDTVVQTILGLKENDCCAEMNKSYIHIIDDIFDLYVERIQKIWLFIPYLYNRSSLKKRYDDLIDKIKTKTVEVINKRKLALRNDVKASQEQNNIWGDRKLLLDFILDATNSEGFTDDEIREHLTTFIVAGFDTTGTTIVFALNLIGAHPHVQERIYKELKEVFGGTDRDVEKDDLSKLIYLEAVLKETIRLYPLVPYISRTNEYDLKLTVPVVGLGIVNVLLIPDLSLYKIDIFAALHVYTGVMSQRYNKYLQYDLLFERYIENYTIPRGATMLCSIYSVNRHPSWGEDAAQFKPERWLQDKVPPALFAGFSLGRRNCIGELYAMTVMKTNMVHVFRRYRVSSSNTDIVLKYYAMLKPVSGHHISIELRS